MPLSSDSPRGFSRRRFLAASSASLAAASTLSSAAEAQEAPSLPPASGRRPRVAAINSIYRLRSHAYHIAGRFLLGYTRNGFHHLPPFDLVRMYNDQSPENDLGPETCERHDVELCKTVEAALGGPDKLDVDAILLIIEHGDYPLNERGQILYPRYELFEKIVNVFRKSGRSVPVFVDKHLSYDHAKAARMVATSRELGFGLMAGSSLPVTWRQPEIEPPLETPFEEAVVCFGYDRGPVEIYLFHALEVLQSMLERRAGGETGVKSLECVQGEAVWKAAAAGRWSRRLLDAALSRCQSCNVGPVEQNVKQPLAVFVEYQDGTKATVLNLIEQVSDFGFAATVRGRPDPVSTCFYLPSPPGARFFDPLTWNIEQFFAAGKPPYPVERTLLTSTLCDFAMRSIHAGGSVIRDPAMAVTYRGPESSGFFRGPYVDAG